MSADIESIRARTTERGCTEAEAETALACDACDWRGPAADAKPVEAAHLPPGDPSPGGRCPLCAALAYPRAPAPADDDWAADDPTLAEPRVVWLALYLVDRCYGGREEGGWWYDAGTLVTDPAIYAEAGGLPQCHGNLRDAIRACGKLNARCESGINAGRRPIESVLSEGEYQWRLFEDTLPPPSFPDARPHYE